MFKFLAPYRLLIALVAGLVGIGGFAMLKIDNARLRAAVRLLDNDLAVCLSRTTNILEDQASDREIDNLDVDALRDLARKWMLEGTSP